MIERQVASRYAPRSLLGLMTQAAANPSDIAKPPAAASAQSFLAEGEMLSTGDGSSIMVATDSGVKTARLMTDEPIFKNQRVWISATGTPGVVGIHGSVR